MFGPNVAYAIAAFALAFSGLAALTLITALSHLDPLARREIEDTSRKLAA